MNEEDPVKKGGCGDANCKVTLTETGAALLPLGVMVIEPLNVVAPSPAMFAETVTAVGVVPLVGLTVSQLPPAVVLAAAVQLMGEALPLVTVRV